MKFTTGLKVAGFAAAFAFATVASAQTPGSSSAMAASGSPSYGTTTSGPTLPNALDTGGMAASPNATDQTGQPQANTAANNGISSNPSTYPADNGSASGSGSMGSSTGVWERVPVLRVPPVALRAVAVDQRSQQYT